MIKVLEAMINQFSPLYGRETETCSFTINELLRPAGGSSETKRALVTSIKEQTYNFMKENEVKKFTGPVVLGVSIYFDPQDFPAGSFVSLFDSWTGDIDNLLKTLCDGLKGELFLDDILVTDIVTKKRLCPGVNSHIKIDAIGTEATEAELESLKVQSFSYEDAFELSKLIESVFQTATDFDVKVSATVPVSNEINIILVGDDIQNQTIMTGIVRNLNSAILNHIDAYVCREPTLNASGQMVVPIKKLH